MQRLKKVWFIKIYDIWFDKQTFLEAEQKFVSLHTNLVLDKSLYDFRLTTQTFLLDITKTEDEIFSRLDKPCRRHLNKARRDGLRVWKAINIAEKLKYQEFQNNFCKGKEIPQISKEELEELEVFCAETPEKEFLGGCAFIISKDEKTVRCKHGATSHKYGANEAILWEAICKYHREGVEKFDFGGCIPTDDKKSYYYRHYQFKKKFGGELTESYTYFKVKGIYRLFYLVFVGLVKLFFKGDVNKFTIWVNKKGMIR